MMCCMCNTEPQVVAKSNILLDVKPVGELLLTSSLMNLFIIICVVELFSGMMKRVSLSHIHCCSCYS